jgi:hypothetical protein
LPAGCALVEAKFGLLEKERKVGFRNAGTAPFIHFRASVRKLLNSNGPNQHSEIALPKPGVRGSSPLRDAIFRTLSMYRQSWEGTPVQPADVMNWLPRELRRAARYRGYTVVTNLVRPTE